MRPVGPDGFVRPLLQSSREEVRCWAIAQGITWREDATNANEAFTRNRLRNSILPALASEFNPNLEGILAGVADVAGAEEEYWEQQIDPLYRNIVKRCDLGLLLGVKPVRSNHRAVQRRLIRQAIANLRGDLRSIDLQHTDAILDLCRSEEGHDRVLIPGVDAIRSFGVLLLTHPGELNSTARDYCIDVSFERKQDLPYGAGSVELRVLNSDHRNCVNVKEESQFPKKEVADLDLEALTCQPTATRLQVRNWRPGDEMVRAGHSKPEKIKALFQQFQVLLWRRRHWPVAVVNDEICWARGFGAAAPFLAQPGSGPVARLCYWPGDEVHELESPSLELEL
jgi:tRNA(Ile)-lysidine synthase